MNAETKRLLEVLVADLIDGHLDDSGREMLNFLLRDNESCRTHYNALMDVQSGMRHLASQPIEASAPSFHLNVESTGQHNSSGSSTLRLTMIPWAIALVSAAALFIVVINLIAPFQQMERQADSARGRESAASRPVPSDSAGTDVRLVQVSGAEYFDGGPDAPGQIATLNREFYLMTGTIMLEFPHGAQAVLEGPSVFTVLGADRLSVKVGHCSVHAPDGAEGFRVETPQTAVVDLGTRFSVRVNDFGATDVQVIEGATEVHSTKNIGFEEKLLLTDGQARRFADDRKGFGQSIPFEPATYAAGLPDRVVRYRMNPIVDKNSAIAKGGELRSLTVQRGNKLLEYSADDLIGIEILSFVPEPNTLNVAASSDGNTRVRDLLEADRDLATGVINPGGAATALSRDAILEGDDATPGLALKFNKPVVNGVGPDVVFFDLQSRIETPGGDGFHVSPLKFNSNLRSHTIQRYDISIRSPEARSVEFDLLTFPSESPLLESSLADQVAARKPSLQFYALAVGIDLSDLGYAIGETAEGLFIQDDASENRQVDPVFIAGFPEFNP